MWEFLYLFFKHTNQIEQIVNDVNYKKKQRINELKDINSHLYKRFYERPFIDLGILGISENLLNSDVINKNNAEIAQLEREIAENRYNKDNGIKFNTCILDDAIEYFIKTGESKMDNKEELKRSLAEEEQRAKDSLANVEKMKKQLEELNKKEEQPTVSATGVVLNSGIKEKRKNMYYISNKEICCNICDQGVKLEYFITKEQAEQEALRREGQEFIRRCAMLWNKGNDWRKKDTVYQYHLYFRPSSNALCYISDNYIAKGIPYFDTSELAERCISELKAKYNEEQIKIIFGVK